MSNSYHVVTMAMNNDAKWLSVAIVKQMHCLVGFSTVIPHPLGLHGIYYIRPWVHAINPIHAALIHWYNY